MGEQHMFINSKLSKAVRLAAVFGAASATAFSANVVAQEEAQAVERIAVTGSSIQRIDVEGALPVTTISAAEIARTGVTSVPELIQSIPAMQGMTAPSSSVGGGGGGLATASLKGLGASYTLTLLNGKRLASYGDGSAVDIKSIPLAAIKRVEILTDGASSLYGSDAIAGVINFILRDDIQSTTVSARIDTPQHGGGENSRFSITTGFGDLEQDGYNVFASYSRAVQERLKSTDRDFAATGFIPFSYGGKDLITNESSANAIPANVWADYNVLDANGAPALDADGDQIEGSVAINPYRVLNNGVCAENNLPRSNNDQCGFDYTSTLEIMPEYTLDNFMVGATVALTDDAELYSTLSYSKDLQTARIAPNPTGGFAVDVASDIVQTDVVNALDTLTTTYNLGTADAPNVVAQDPAANLSAITAAWRILPGGNRTNEWEHTSMFFDTGVRGSFDELTYDVSVTYSEFNTDDTTVTGYPIAAQLGGLLSGGTLPLFRPMSEWGEGDISTVANAMYSGLEGTSESSTLALEGKGSLPVYELPAGDVYVGFGFDYRTQEYVSTTSQDNKDTVRLWSDADPEYDLSRDRYAMFAETIIPVTEQLELTVAGRYDSIDAVDSTIKLWEGSDGQTPATEESGIYGETMSDFTYKVSAAFRPVDALLIRASFGTGFRAPSMSSISSPRIPGGVTGVEYGCTYGDNDPRAQFCKGTNWQWDVFSAGNVALQPETSEQMSVGFVFSPSEQFNMSIDWWDVTLNDLIRSPTQAQIVTQPDVYPELHTTKLEKGSGQTLAAIISSATNVAESRNEGIDYSFEYKQEFGEFDYAVQLTGTHMLVSEDQNVADPTTYDTSLGLMGPNDAVTFDDQISIRNTVAHGKFTHGLNVTYRSGWLDSVYPWALDASTLASADMDVQLDVDSYFKVDYSLGYVHDEHLSVMFGVNNLLDQEPPFSLGDSGGHQVGYNARYYDSIMRSVHATVTYTF
jgi:iron complex outermembrane receptor protein